MKDFIEKVANDWIAYARHPSPAEDAPDQVTADSWALGKLVEDAWEGCRASPPDIRRAAGKASYAKRADGGGGEG